MTDHAARAEHILEHLERAIATGDAEWAPIMAAQAQVHATLEQAKWLQEIANQLDTLPRSGRPHVDEDAFDEIADAHEVAGWSDDGPGEAGD